MATDQNLPYVSTQANESLHQLQSGERNEFHRFFSYGFEFFHWKRNILREYQIKGKKKYEYI